MPAHRGAVRRANVGRGRTRTGSEVLLLPPLCHGGRNLIRILLAEDNQGDVILVEEALAEHKIAHELHVVSDGAEALNFVAEMGNGDGPPCPDVLLLDLNLPKVDGP